MTKNKVEVVIGGNILALQGDESEEHMQRVAKVINEKLTEIQSNYEKAHLGQSKINTLLTLNLADECVKKQEMIESYKASLNKLQEENKKLYYEVEKLNQEILKVREQLACTTHQGKKEHGNRGR